MKKCRQKHGGFWALLTPLGTYGYRYLPLTNRDAMLLTKSFTPLVSLVDVGTCKNNEKMFLLTGKS